MHSDSLAFVTFCIVLVKNKNIAEYYSIYIISNYIYCFIKVKNKQFIIKRLAN